MRLVDGYSLVIEDISMIVIITGNVDDRTTIDVHCRATGNSWR